MSVRHPDQPPVEDGEHAPVGFAADQAAEPLLEGDDGLGNLILIERRAAVRIDLPDARLALNEDAKRSVVRLFRKHRPRVVFTSHWDDPHPDHAATCRIVREAARLATMKRYDAAAGLEVVKMPSIAHAVYSRLVVPSFIIDVSDFVEGKMNAIRAHASQFYSVESKEPTTRIAEKGFLQDLEWRLRYYGSLIGVRAGEPFYVREALNVDDPVALLTRPMNIYS